MASSIDRLIDRDVEAIARLRRTAHERRTTSQRIADAMASVAGNMKFVLAHVIGFAVWIALNSGLVDGVWDPYPFVMLATVVSLEAIVLSSLVLASQNRAQRLADQHADLDLHVNLMAEREGTRILARVDAIARKVGAELPDDDGETLKQDLAPSRVLEALAREADDDEHMIVPSAEGKADRS